MRKSNIAKEPEPPSRELEALVLTHIQPLLWQHLHTFLYVPTVLLCGSCFLARHYPPLSSVSGIEKGGSLPEYGSKWASSLSSSDLSWSFHHSWHCLTSLFLDLPLLFATFCERNKVMSETELAAIVLQIGDLSGKTQTVMVSLSRKSARAAGRLG